MKKLILTSSALVLCLSLVGCNTMNSASQYSNSTVGSGVRYGATTIGTGVDYVTGAGAAVGNGIGTVVGGGIGFVTGQPGTYQHTNTLHRNNVVYHNGHRYIVQNGRYVLVR